MSACLEQELAQLAVNCGADLFGIADLSVYPEQIGREYGSELLAYGKAISVAVFFPRQIMAAVEQGPTHQYLTYYDALNTRINDICYRLANRLNRLHYLALPIPASQRLGDGRLQGLFSHRLAAHLAGLGFIGKNCALIHPEAGPWLRLGTVLTDAPLEAPAEPMAGACGTCQKCVEICPAQAIRGKAFAMDQPLSERFDGEACDRFLTEMRISFGKRICGRCIATCPWGKKGGGGHDGANADANG